MAFSMSVNTKAVPPTRTSGPRPSPRTAGGEPPQVVRVPGVDPEAVVGQDDPPAAAVPFDVGPGEIQGDVGVCEGAQTVGRPRLEQLLPLVFRQQVCVVQLAIDEAPDFGQNLQLFLLVGGQPVVDRADPAEQPGAFRLARVHRVQPRISGSTSSRRATASAKPPEIPWPNARSNLSIHCDGRSSSGLVLARLRRFVSSGSWVR